MGKYFGVGIENPQQMANVGVAWRSSYQLGASFIFTIGKKYKRTPTDTYKVSDQIPLLEFPEVKYAYASIHQCDWIAVETEDRKIEGLTPVPLWDFKHPKKAIYLFGNEKNGLTEDLLISCKHHVYIPSVRQGSYNVSMSLTLVLWDRLFKNGSRHF